MSNVIPFSYQGRPVRFNSDGWINATDVARRYGKRPVDWLKQSETRRYMNVLAAALNCDPGALLETRRGRHQGGTWLHPKLAVATDYERGRSVGKGKRDRFGLGVF